MKSLIKWVFDISLRPPRATYDLDNTVCAIEGRNQDLYIRHDCKFDNDNNQTLYGSLWHDSKNTSPTACVIYLHSLGTNQFECVNLVPFLCTEELAIFSFDFSGSGLSDGDTIPLIGRGCQDVFAASQYLKNHWRISNIGIWGRSMGAAIGLDTVSISNDFACIVSDSAFASTHYIVYDQANLKGLPPLFVKMVKPILKKEARKIVGPTIDLDYPLKDISFSATPLFMGHGKDDSFVPIHQARKIFDIYGCSDKMLYIMDGQHNTPRPSQWYEAAARFMYRKLGIQQKPKIYDLEYKKAKLHIGKLDGIPYSYNN